MEMTKAIVAIVDTGITALSPFTFFSPPFLFLQYTSALSFNLITSCGKVRKGKDCSRGVPYIDKKHTSSELFTQTVERSNLHLRILPENLSKKLKPDYFFRGITHKKTRFSSVVFINW